MQRHKFLIGFHNSSEGFIAATFLLFGWATMYAAQCQAEWDDKWARDGRKGQNPNVWVVIDTTKEEK